MTYFVTTPNAVDRLEISGESLLSELRAMWPQSETVRPADATQAYAWDFRSSHDNVELRVFLTGDGTAIVIEGEHHVCLEFAAWLRTCIAAEHPLILFDSGYDHCVDLVPSVTAADLSSVWR
jgi:hypothetical protein